LPVLANHFQERTSSVLVGVDCFLNLGFAPKNVVAFLLHGVLQGHGGDVSFHQKASS